MQSKEKSKDTTRKKGVKKMKKAEDNQSRDSTKSLREWLSSTSTHLKFQTVSLVEKPILAINLNLQTRSTSHSGSPKVTET